MPPSLYLLSLFALLCALDAGDAQLSCAANSNPSTADVVFLVDGSSSVAVANFSAQVAGVSNLANALFMAAPNTRVSFIEYATAPCSDKGLCSSFATSFSAFASTLTPMRSLGGSTNIGAALQYVNDVYTPLVRRSIQLLVVVITGGVSADSTSAALASLLRSGASVYAIAVNVDSANLLNVTSSGQVVYAPSFQALQTPDMAANIFNLLLCPGKKSQWAMRCCRASWAFGYASALDVF